MLLRPQRCRIIFSLQSITLPPWSLRHKTDGIQFLRAALECGSNRFVVSNAARAGTCPGRKTSYECLLFHPWLCAQRTSYIVKVAHLIPLIGGKGHDAVSAGWTSHS